MGCFNGTCSLSNLPIFAGEKVVLIPLIKTINKTSFHCCNATDNFTPFGFPIIAEYNDYGGIENAVTDKNNENFLYNHFYFYETNDTDEGYSYVEVDKPNSFDEFINETFCNENCYVQGNNFSFHPNGLVKINFMMIHYNLYKKIINEIANRKPYNQKQSYQTLYKEKYLTTLDKYQKIIETSEKLAEETKSITDIAEKTDALLKLSKESSILDIANDIFCFGNFLNRSSWTFFADILLFKKNGWKIILDKAVEKVIFTTALNYMRKGYLCDSGAGSQCTETRLHIILADFIKEHVKNYAIAFNEEVMDEEEKLDKNGTAESLYFYK